jgi:hypothetical protein
VQQRRRRNYALGEIRNRGYTFPGDKSMVKAAPIFAPLPKACY